MSERQTNPINVQLLATLFGMLTLAISVLVYRTYDLSGRLAHVESQIETHLDYHPPSDGRYKSRDGDNAKLDVQIRTDRRYAYDD